MAIGAELRSRLSHYLTPPIPPRLANRHTQLDPAQTGLLRQAIITRFFPSAAPDELAMPALRNDIEAHISQRLAHDRQFNVPWLDSVRKLDGARVLEIGCGTGASTVALAEQGAQVTAIDIDEGSMTVARQRLALHGVEAEIEACNATDIKARYAHREFDFIIFWASLEHMTLEERLATIAQSWTMLEPGCHWAVIECPNRLHYFDNHTSLLPFFFWLPDDLALKYARFSERAEYRDACKGQTLETNEGREVVARWGRGMSYHELELALDRPVRELKIVSSLMAYRMGQSPAFRARRLASFDHFWERMLRRQKPDAPAAVFEHGLNFVMEKA